MYDPTIVSCWDSYSYDDDEFASAEAFQFRALSSSVTEQSGKFKVASRGKRDSPLPPPALEVQVAKVL